MTISSYLEDMTLTHRTLLNEDGQPEAAVIPWDVFQQIKELIESDEPTKEEIEACQEAERDRREGNTEAFIPLAEVKARLGL